MRLLTLPMLAGLVCSTATPLAMSSENITLPATDAPPLFDGRCDREEWRHALEIRLPEQTAVLLMYDQRALYVCAKGKPIDYTALDIYAENTDSKRMHNLHVSAQLAERTLENNQWSDMVFWNQQQWGGFWVPYAGEKATDQGSETQFLAGSHREIQILRTKFPGDLWRLMFRVSAVYQHDKYGAEFYYPNNATDKNPGGWASFSFSK